MFTEIFIEILQKNNITPYQVAKNTGISQGLMGEYKKGIKLPTIPNLIKIADYLDCSVDYLLGRTDNPNSHKLVVSETPKLSVAVRAARSFDDKPIEIVEVDESKFINAPEKKL